MPETNDEIKTEDGAEITVNSGNVPKRKQYKVTAVGGLFKRGVQIDAGQLVELDEVTAKNFKAAGDIAEDDDGVEVPDEN